MTSTPVARAVTVAVVLAGSSVSGVVSGVTRSKRGASARGVHWTSASRSARTAGTPGRGAGAVVHREDAALAQRLAGEAAPVDATRWARRAAPGAARIRRSGARATRRGDTRRGPARRGPVSAGSGPRAAGFSSRTRRRRAGRARPGRGPAAGERVPLGDDHHALLAPRGEAGRVAAARGVEHRRRGLRPALEVAEPQVGRADERVEEHVAQELPGARPGARSTAR